LNISIQDPKDKSVAAITKNVGVSGKVDSWKASLHIPAGITLAELAWDRVKIEAGTESKIASLSEILRLPVARVLAQRAYAAGSPAAIRIITVDSKSGLALAGSKLEVELVEGARSTPLFSGVTDRLGTASVQFSVPSDLSGNMELRVNAQTVLGSVRA